MKKIAYNIEVARNKTVEYFLPADDFTKITTLVRGEGPHLQHYETGYKYALQAAKKHLKLVFAQRDQPTKVFRPEVLTWNDFRNERQSSSYFDWNFTDNSREFAEKIGIRFGPRVVDSYSQEALEEEIAEFARDPDALSTFLNPHPEKFVPEEHYTGDLTPIIPQSAFLNHDRSLYGSSGLLGTASAALYLDLVGEGTLPIKSPWSRSGLTIKEQARMVELFQPAALDDLTDPEQIFALIWGKKQYQDIPEAIDFYRRHMRHLRKGILSFPDEATQNYTYLKDYDIGTSGEQATSGMKTMNVRFQIDVEELLHWRNIFTDPEGITSEHEYGKTYIVPGGVPLQAVTGYEFWVDHGNNLPPLMEKEGK